MIFSPALADHSEQSAPVARIFPAFCSTSSLLGARHRTRLPWLRACSSLAMAAMTWLLPAPVGSDSTILSVLRDSAPMAASTADCW